MKIVELQEFKSDRYYIDIQKVSGLRLKWLKIKNFADTNYNNSHFRHFLITTRLTRLDFIIITLKAGRDQEEDPIKITEEEKTEMATNVKGYMAVDKEVISQNSKAILRM